MSVTVISVEPNTTLLSELKRGDTFINAFGRKVKKSSKSKEIEVYQVVEMNIPTKEDYEEEKEVIRYFCLNDGIEMGFEHSKKVIPVDVVITTNK